MMYVPVGQLTISPTRQRREFDDAKTQELARSIQAHGLFHPPVVRILPDATVQLVAGERRLRAIEQLRFLGKTFSFDGKTVGEDLIPCVVLGELNEFAAEEAELDENIRRVDLTWQERAAATSKLMALRDRQAVSVGAPLPKVAAIAQEVRGSSEGVNQETTRRELIVAKSLADPEIQGAKTVDDAFKILKRREETQRRVDLAVSVGRTFTAAAHTALNVDAAAWMQAYAGELFHVILTDPPYGMGADQFGDSGGIGGVGSKTTAEHNYDDSYESWKAIMAWFAPQSFRVTRPQAHLYAFCDFDRFHELKGYLTAAGWSCFRTPLVWHNPNKARAPWPDRGPQRKYEICIYANKGQKPVTKIFPDLVTYTSDDNLGHQAQKPVGLFLDLLRRSVAPGDSVLDPFAGSGTIFPAAHELKCMATGLEQAPQHYALCLKRLEKLSAQQELVLDSKALISGLVGGGTV